MSTPDLALPRAAQPRFCPLVAIPMPTQGGVEVRRIACDDKCACYDRRNGRPCFENLIDTIQRLTAAVREAKAP